MTVFDYGPLQPLILDTSITEIMINAPDQIFVEHWGVIILTDLRFSDDTSLWHFVRRVLELDCDRGSQGLYFDGVLPNGSRYNIVLPPMAAVFPYVTIRKSQNKRWGLGDLVEMRSISEEAARFLGRAVKEKKNIIVSGGSGAGKTCFLQALAGMIPVNERIVTIEDVPEIRLGHRNWIRLTAVREAEKIVSIRDCVANCLRMRPDRILVGECRRDEVFDMLQAMNTGHEGSMTTIHANSPSECLMRLENLLLMAKLEVPLKALRSQIALSVQFIVQVKRESSGHRVVTEVLELTGMEGDIITRASLFSMNSKGQLEPTGYVSKYIR